MTPTNNLMGTGGMFADSKRHFVMLDGLRGTAALVVVCFHIMEVLCISAGKEYVEGFNHGYLAVDFFFILSGFVIGYAYDDRVGKTMSTGSFIKRRLIRLHPMIAAGAVIGAVSFIIQGRTSWAGVEISVGWVVAALLMTMLMIPTLPGTATEVRGYGEMYPLNGPAWSLFFEYIGNLLYVLFIHRLGNKCLLALVVASGCGLATFMLMDVSGWGTIGVGWMLDSVNFWGGMLRMLFPYTLGMYMARKRFSFPHVPGAFWICSLLLTLMAMVPFLPGKTPVLWNSVYEMGCIMVLFPLIVLIASQGDGGGATTKRVYGFLGNLSYPLYAVHYPIIYYFLYWLRSNHKTDIAEVIPQALAVVCFSMVLAYFLFRHYDVPLRKWLVSKFMK